VLTRRRSDRTGGGGTSIGGRTAAGEDAIAAVCLLVDADIMGEAAEEVELGFDPAKDLVGWGEDFEVAKADWMGRR
jgi:hypothetical protein